MQVHRTKQKSTASGNGRPTLCLNCQGLEISPMKLFSLLILAVAFLPHSCSSSHKRVDYGDAKAYTGRGCTEEWCGEKWRKDRILWYNYTVENKLVWMNVSNTTTHNDCSNGAQISTLCEPKKTATTYELKKVRKVTFIRDKTPVESKNTTELDTDRLLTDNINVSNQVLSDTYPLNQDKIWQFGIPKGCKLRVTFHRFEIESTKNCERDYFSVQASKNPEDVFVFCDYLSEIVIQRRKRVQFKFHSDNGVHNGGIHAQTCLQDMNEDGSNNCNCKQRRRRDTSLDSSSSPDEEHGSIIVNRAVQEEKELSTVEEQLPIEQLSNYESQRSLTLDQLHSLGRSHNQQSSS